MQVALRRRFSKLTRVGRSRAQQAAQARFAGAHERFVTAPVRVPDGVRVVAAPDAAAARLRSGMPTRSDAAATRAALVVALVACMDEHGVIAAGHALLAALAGKLAGRSVSRSCAGVHLRALERAGILVVVMRGCSKLVNGSGRDFCPLYVVVEPDVLPVAEQSALEVLKAQLSGRTWHLPVGHMEFAVDLKGAPGRKDGTKIGRIAQQRQWFPERFVPRNAQERTDVIRWLAEALQLDLRYFGLDIRRAVSKFLSAGWTGAQVMYAVGHAPDGTPDESRVVDGRQPAKVLNFRLTRWRDRSGHPIAAPAARPAPVAAVPGAAGPGAAGPGAAGCGTRQPAPVPDEDPPGPVTPYTPRRMGAAAAAEVAKLRAMLTRKRDASRAAGR